MISIGDYVTFGGYGELRGIVLAGPRRIYNRFQYRIMWNEATKPQYWNARPNGAWEYGDNIKVLSSLETR